MTNPEGERLARVEEKQKAMTKNLADLKVTLRTNTDLTRDIKKTLDELTGVKKFLIWFTGALLGGASVIATYLGVHHK